MDSKQNRIVNLGDNNINMQDIRDSVITVNQIIHKETVRIETPLSPQEEDRFKAEVIIYTIKYEEDPVNPPDFNSIINPLMQKVIANPAYERQYPFHVGMLYRLYCSIYLVCEISTNNNWDALYKNIDHILDYSFSLLEDNKEGIPSDYDGYYKKYAAQLSIYKESLRILKNLYNNFKSDKITTDTFHHVLSCSLVFALPTKKENAIQKKADMISSSLIELVTGPTRDFKFFMESKNRIFSSMGSVISMVRNVLLIRNDKPIEELPNPYYYKMNDGPHKGKTQIEFKFFDNEQTLEFNWIVSATTPEIGSTIGTYAQMLTNFWAKNLTNMQSIETMLSMEPLEYTYKDALDYINQGGFMKAIINLLKVTSLKEDWAEPHWYLSKALYGHLTNAGNSSDFDHIKKELDTLVEGLSESEKQNKFEDYLKDASSDEFAVLHHILTSNFPEWISDELKTYIKYAPNGEFVNGAERLLRSLSNVI